MGLDWGASTLMFVMYKPFFASLSAFVASLIPDEPIIIINKHQFKAMYRNKYRFVHHVNIIWT